MSPSDTNQQLSWSSFGARCVRRKGVLALFALLMTIASLTYLVTVVGIATPSFTYRRPQPVRYDCPPLNSTKVAMLIELRSLPSLVPILLHYMATVPADWPFHVFHSAENAKLLTQSHALKKHLDSGKLVTTQLGADVRLQVGNDVSMFLTDRWIWNQLVAEHIFFFQLDAMICSNSDQTIDSYTKYDWVGAPWPHLRDIRGGNGGFSMRRKSRLLRCLDKQKWFSGGEPEDVWYARCLASFPDAVLPTYEEAMEFAIEGQESPRYMGIHKPFNGVLVSAHYDFCPEAAMLFLP
ncbi:hypothetical protein HKX48_008020 [Thoreauomyces humboldtii]|nr:hypothetical protein HKX48_008020 [Thoreauomyces humboldtii]